MAERVLNLFGEMAAPPLRGRGRPEHVATPKTRARVLLAFARGWSVKRVAAVLGITQPTLRKHYFAEVAQRDVAVDRARMGLMEKLIADGSTAALKEVGRMLERDVLDAAGAAYTKPAKAKPKGKKAALDEAAKRPTDEWGELLTPTGASGTLN